MGLTTLCVELEDFFVDPEAFCVELDTLCTDAMTFGVELADLIVELDATILVSLEPRIGILSRDEVETLLDLLADLMEDDTRMGLEDTLPELDPCVEVVGR